MIDGSVRSIAWALLTSTTLATPAIGQTVQPPSVPPKAQSNGPDQSEIIITATKREENVQNVPINVIALGTRRLDQLDISNFEDYTKQLPSVSFLTTQPGQTTVYMRGVSAAGGTNAEGNHSGPLPQVGTYLDEQPVTTIGGTLDIHIYDVARIESLSGPQGTLYGASSEAGTIRIITNKPQLGVTTGRIDGELNSIDHGGVGGKLEGMINLPIAPKIAFRGVAFYERDAGFIDNISGSRTYYVNNANSLYGTDENGNGLNEAGNSVTPVTVTNAGLEKKNFNTTDVYGGRAALKVDLDDNWTATPTFMYQKTKSNGVFFYDPTLGDLKIDRFRPEPFSDRFWQAALTIEGKIAGFDVTYAGAYMDRPNHGENDYADYTDAYDRNYAASGGLLYFYYQDAAGNQLPNPQQYILFSNHFKKMSHELRIASPADKPFRLIAGAFLQHQSNLIHQDYRVDGLAPNLSVNGLPGTIWLTQEKRVDRDYALFGEASWDILPTVTLTGGGRVFRYDNSLVGFFGFGRDPNGPPWNAAGSSHTGVASCFAADGSTVADDTGAAILPAAVTGSPCTDLGVYENGTVVPKHVKGSGFTHRLNAQWKPEKNLMFYATWSRGFRPGGLNRRADVAPYDPDYLTNWEMGWKTTFGPFRWNGDIFHEVWRKFQFAFLGQYSLTEVHNGKDARINGLETDVSYFNGGLTLNAAAAYTDAKTKGTICTNFSDTTPDCSAAGDFPSVPNGTRLPITPKFKATGTARYSWPAWADVKAHAQGTVTYRGSAPSSLRTAIALSGSGEIVNPNVFQGDLHAATLVDFYTGLDWPKWNLEAFVTNIFDKRDDLSRQTACASCTRALVVPGRPRTIGIRAGMKF